MVAIGVFDGLHRGHQAVISQLRELAREYRAAPSVVTFDPSPASVLAPDDAPRQIATIDQRLCGLEALGVQRVRVLTFSKALSSETATEFIERVLVGDLHATCVLVGEDFHFGHNREGTVGVLRAQGARLGFDVVVAPTHGDGVRFSSSAVRNALAAGDVDEARRVLGRPFVVSGVVEHGDRRGEELGFPTANLGVTDEQALPASGVYAGAAKVSGTWWAAAISVGTRPQFYENGELLVEVYVLDFEGSLYGQQLDVAFLARLREQSTFDSEQELVDQIARDVAQSREVFTSTAPQDMKLLG